MDGATTSGGYLIKKYPDQSLSRLLINPRRGIKYSVPILGENRTREMEARDEIFTRFGLEEYTGMASAEMARRPIPSVFKEEKTRTLTALFSTWIGEIIAYGMRNLKAPVQTLNKQSALGWPERRTPDDKKQALAMYTKMIMAGDIDWLDDAFFLCNVRLQAERRSKKRDYQFISQGGEPYEATVGLEDRTVSSPYGDVTAARTRLIMICPVSNQIHQAVDTALHNVWISHPLCHHEMYSKHLVRPSGSQVFAMDVKNFDRYIGGCYQVRAAAIGGTYAAINEKYARMPYLVPSDSWSKQKRTDYLLMAAPGHLIQFGSGLSCVAPLGKEVFIALNAEFGLRELGIPRERCLQWALDGGDTRIRLLNYGDDNTLFGEKGVIDAYYAFIGSYLPVEPEEPTKFLGFLYTDKGWRLGVSSYLEKTYLNEREPYSAFRTYPCLGWTLKREVYREYGVPEIMREVYPFENDMLERYGTPWSKVEERAERERQSIRDIALTNRNFLLGKDYLMTAEEKLATGLFSGWTEKETAPMVRAMIGKEWIKELKF